MDCYVNGMRLYYEVQGGGRPLILLHGNGQTHGIFDRAAPLLAQHFTVYAPDSRGHGRSGPVKEYRYTDMAEDFKGFLEVLGLERPILYGFSDGGIIALLLAGTYPKLLSRIVVSGANTEVEGIRGGWLTLFRAINALVKEPKMDMMLQPPGISTDLLRKIVIPTTVLAGSRDMVRQAHTRYIAENIPGSTLRILPGENHGSYVVHSAKIAELILDSVQNTG